jgi:hypothetical protein
LIGQGNLIQGGVGNLFLIGSNNEVTESGVMAVGNNMAITDKGLNVENIYVHGEVVMVNGGFEGETGQLRRASIIIPHEQIVTLFSSPLVLTFESLGLPKNYIAVPVRSAFYLNTDAGGNYTGAQSLLLRWSPTVSTIFTSMGTITATGYQTNAYTSQFAQTTIQTGWQFICPANPGAGGAGNYLHIQIYYFAFNPFPSVDEEESS